MIDDSIIGDLPPERKERIFWADRALSLLKWVIGSVVITLISLGISAHFKDREIKIEENKQEAELQREELEAIGKYVEFALAENIDNRIRFAHYFSRIINDEDSRTLWAAYYDELLAAKGEGESDKLTPSDRIGGNLAISDLSALRDQKKIILSGDADVSVDQLRSWALGRGWSDVGFHFLVRPDGSVETGRDTSRTPAIAGGFNTNSIAIQLGCQNYDIADSKSYDEACIVHEDQYNELEVLIRRILEEHDIPVSMIFENSTLMGPHRRKRLQNVISELKRSIDI